MYTHAAYHAYRHTTHRIHVNIHVVSAEGLMALLKSTMVDCFPAMCIVGGLVLTTCLTQCAQSAVQS